MLHHRCLYHGCLKCYPENCGSTRHPRTKLTMTQLFNQTMDKKNDLKQAGYRYVSMWECQWREMMTRNDVRNFVQGLNIQDRLDPRDAFYGGGYQ